MPCYKRFSIILTSVLRADQVRTEPVGVGPCLLAPHRLRRYDLTIAWSNNIMV